MKAAEIEKFGGAGESSRTAQTVTGLWDVIPCSGIAKSIASRIVQKIIFNRNNRTISSPPFD